MRRFASIAFLLCLGLAAMPAAAQKRTVFAGVTPTVFSKKWSADLWQVWALPSGKCLELIQFPGLTPFRFWGFRQSPGSRVDLIMGSIETPRAGDVQVTFNGGRRLDYAARVEQESDWPAYVISIQPNALAVLHDQTIIDLYADGEHVFWGMTNKMRDGEKLMQKCLDWQTSH